MSFDDFFSSAYTLAANYWPKFLAGIIVFLLGYWLAVVVERLVRTLFDRLKINAILDRMGVDSFLTGVGFSLNAGKFFGIVAKWCAIIIVLMGTFEIFGLTQVSDWLQTIALYLPNIGIATLIFILAIYLADFSERIVVGSFEKAEIRYSRFIGTTVRIILWAFTILAIFMALGIAPDLIKIMLIGLIITIALSIGLAFGLGGKDFAHDLLQDLKGKIK